MQHNIKQSFYDLFLFFFWQIGNILRIYKKCKLFVWEIRKPVCALCGFSRVWSKVLMNFQKQLFYFIGITYILVPELVNLVMVCHTPLHDIYAVPVARLHFRQSLASGAWTHFLHRAQTFFWGLNLYSKCYNNSILTIKILCFPVNVLARMFIFT